MGRWGRSQLQYRKHANRGDSEEPKPPQATVRRVMLTTCRSVR